VRICSRILFPCARDKLSRCPPVLPWAQPTLDNVDFCEWTAGTRNRCPFALLASEFRRALVFCVPLFPVPLTWPMPLQHAAIVQRMLSLDSRLRPSADDILLEPCFARPFPESMHLDSKGACGGYIASEGLPEPHTRYKACSATRRIARILSTSRNPSWTPNLLRLHMQLRLLQLSLPSPLLQAMLRVQKLCNRQHQSQRSPERALNAPAAGTTAVAQRARSLLLFVSLDDNIPKMLVAHTATTSTRSPMRPQLYSRSRMSTTLRLCCFRAR
jgi:hypothetical protein